MLLRNYIERRNCEAMKRLSLLLLILTLAACQDRVDNRRITEARQAPKTQTAESPAALPAGHPALPAGHPALPAGHPALPMAGVDKTAAAPLTWTAPAGWKESGPRPMRLVSFTMGAPGMECYVALLAGPAGGLEANLNRWRGQMGLAPLSLEEIGRLEKIPVLGQQVPLAQMEGNFSGMQSMQGEPKKGYALLGTVAASGGQSVFVKMVGPAGAVKEQRANFISFCESLKAAAGPPAANW
jgi:hypothetical protein